MRQRSSLSYLTTCALMAALLCVLGPMTLPIGPVPVTLVNLVLFVAAYLLGARDAVVSCGVYLLLGAAGLPVFSGYQGGLAKLAGPTGGFLVGYLALCLLCGLAAERGQGRPLVFAVGMVLGEGALYSLGTAWFMMQTGNGLRAALSLCVLPFLPLDAVKMAAALALGQSLRRALEKADLLEQWD